VKGFNKMYICNKCGNTCEYPEIKVTCPETSISPAEKEMKCCECGGRFVEAATCVVCGYDFPRSEIWLNNYICEDCLRDEAEARGYEYGLEIGNDNMTDVYINGLVATLLTDEEINKILLDYVEANKENIKNFNWKCEKYCREDLWCLSQYVEDKVKNEN
jgi:hypothetical protein